MKLSKLQRWILLAALRNRESGRGLGILTSSTDHAADLSFAEIKSGYYHFRKAKKEFEPRWNFHSTDISNYRAASASISRAVRRLHERCLVQIFDGRNWAAVRLTDSGIKAAKEMQTCS